MIITSFANPLIKHIRKLRTAKHRYEEGEFFIEGAKFVIEAFESNWDIQKVIIAPDQIKSKIVEKYIDKLLHKGIQVIEVSSDVFESFAAKELVQGISAIVKIKQVKELPAIIDRQELWIGLEEIQDPGNLGTILRTADAAGASGIILINDCVDLYDPAVIRSSMGAFFTQPVIHSNLEDIKSWLVNKLIRVYGTSDKAQVSFHDVDYSFPALLLMGSERKGLSLDAAKLCDLIVSIPMKGKSDSLNLAVATGIMLYEMTKES